MLLMLNGTKGCLATNEYAHVFAFWGIELVTVFLDPMQLCNKFISC